MPVSDISLTESSHSVGVEDEPAPLSSSMLLKQINTSPAGGFSEDGSSQPIGGQAGLQAPNRVQQQQKSSAYIEDIISGEYQSRFLTQVTLLEPIFTAPFASFQFPPSASESDETDLGKLEKDRAKCCDLFAAGCLIYQLLSGVPLFTKVNISQYLEGDGTWWWGSASQPIPRRFKSLVFELILAGRPYFAYAIQNGLSVGYVTSIILGSASVDAGGDSNTTEVQMDDPFDFGRARLTPQQTASIAASNTPTSTTSSQQTTTSAVVSAPPAPGVPTPPSTITLANLGQLSEGIIDKFLNDDLISAPTSMKVFPSHFELAYQFLCRYHSTTSWNKRVTLALDNISFLVNLPLSGLDLILPDLLSFFDHQESVVDALALIEPLAIKMGKVMTIEKLLGPVVGLYERIQRQQQHHHQQASASSSSAVPSSSVGTGALQSSSMDHSVQLALELLASRFVHTLLSKFGQTCFLKHIVGFLVNEVRSTKKEIGFAAGSALLRLVSILSPPIYIRHVLYPLLAQLNKANTEVLSATIVEIGARMGEDVILRHHMEVIIPLLQLHIFQKEDAISVRISTTLLRLISSLVGLLHPTKILPTMMMDHRCLFSILLNPPSDRGVWDALLDCLSSVSSAIGLHNAIKYARPYVQQFFSLYGNAPSTAATSEIINDSSKSYPTMVMMRFKDLLDVRSGGGNVSIQQALGPALRIESYLMGPTMASSTTMPASTLPTIAPPTVIDDDSPSITVLPSVTTLGHSGSVVSPSATRISHSASSISSQESNGSSDSGSNTLTVPTPVTGSSTTDSSNSDQTSERPTIAPRRLSSPVRPVSPTLTALANPPALNADSSKDSPAVILRLATANEDGHVADAMPTWLANLHGAPYVPQVQMQQSGSTQSSGRNLNASLASGANPTSAGGSAPSANPPTSPAAAAAAASAGISTGGGGASAAMMTSPLGSGVGGSTSSHGTNASIATGSGSGTGSTQAGNERIPPKKALHILGSQASTPMAPGLPNPSAPWDTLQESTVTPAVLPPFGPAVTQSPFGAAWPPTHGPSQTWNFTGISGHSFREHSGAIRCVSVHDNERLFLSGSKDTTVKCWDLLSEGSSRQTYSGHKFPINQAEFVDRGNLVASCDGSIHVWELERGTKLTHMDAYSVSAHASNSSLAKGEGGGGPSALFTCFASHQDGRVLVCGTSLSTVTFTDLRAEQEVVCEWYLPTTIPGTSTSSSSSSSSGSSTGSSSGISSGSASISSAGAAAYPRAISLGHIDQNLMVVGQSSGHMTLIDIRSGLLLYNWRAHEGPISSVKAVPDASGYLVSSSLDKTIYLWDIANASQTSPVGLTQFRGHSDSHISFDTFRGNLYSVSGQKIAIAPLFGQPSSVLLDKRKLIKTNALKLTNMLTSFNILQLQHLALVGYDDGSIKVTQ
jgi:WD40 repeat protein